MPPSRVTAAAVSRIRPSSATGPFPERVELSVLDTFWISFPPTQRLLVFHGAALPPFHDLVLSLKASLSTTLSLYYPLAGKLACDPSSGQVFIDCSAADSEGVPFFEAEAAEGLDVRRLATDEVLDMDAFLQLVPEISVVELPAPLLAVQVTRFGEGEGVVVGVAAHHAAADGKGIWRFIEAWAAECRGGGGPPPPVVDRTVISHPKLEEISKNVMKWVAPNLPKLRAGLKKPIEVRLALMRRTFVITPKHIQFIKSQPKLHHHSTATPSSFVSVASHAWRALLHAKGFHHDHHPDQKIYLLIQSDCRTRTDPPIDAGYLGNCLIPIFARATIGDLLGSEDGQAKACAAIQDVMHKYLLSHDPLKDNDWMDQLSEVDQSMTTHVAGSHRFRVYDAMDFGWGRPSRAELVSLDEDGQLSFACARDGVGIQMTVSLDPKHMEDFAKYLVDGLEPSAHCKP